MATIKDVAKIAGVSISTVSNIMNGKGSVQGNTYERVMKAVEELKYRPSYVAQNMRSNKMNMIGVLLPSLEQPYCDIYDGILRSLNTNTFFAVLKLTENNAALETETIHLFSDMGISGMIVVPCETDNVQKYREVQERGIPLVFVERDVKGIDCSKVLFDNHRLIYEVSGRLLSDYAPDQTALVRSKSNYSPENECEQAFLEAGGYRIIRVPDDKNAAMLKLYSFLCEEKEGLECLITSNLAYGRVANDVSRLLNRDISIHALCNDEWCLSNPYGRITPIHRNTLYAGIHAANLLSTLIEKKYQATNQTVQVPDKVFSPVDFTSFSDSKSKLRILALECDTIEVLQHLGCSAKNHLGLEVEFDKRSYSELRLALLEQITHAKTEYDIVMIDMPWLGQLDRANYLYELEQELAVNMQHKYDKRIGDAFFRHMRGRNVVPLVSGIQAIYYRADCFQNQDLRAEFSKKYGFELNVPRSWTEYNTVCQFFTRKYNAQSPFLSGTNMAVGSPTELVHEFLPRQWSFYGKVINDDGRIVLDQDGNVRALNNLRETYRYCSQQQGDATLDDEFFGLLLRGEVPIVNGFTSHYHPERETEQDYSKFISVAPMPQGRCVLGGWALGVNRHSSRIRESCKYLEWLLCDQISIANMRMNGCIPTLAVHRNAELRLHYAWLNLMNDAFTKGGNRETVFTRGHKQVESKIIDDILSRAIMAALNSEADSFDLLAQAKEELAEQMR
jgi:multiple sugar transport system substrate-binding protein